MLPVKASPESHQGVQAFWAPVAHSLTWPCNKHCNFVKENTAWNCPTWAGTIVTICMNYLMTRGSDKEHGTNKLQPTGAFGKGWKETPHALPTSQDPPCWNPPWPSNTGGHQQEGPFIRVIGQRQPGNSSHHRSPAASHEAEQFWVPSPPCSLPRPPFLHKTSSSVSSCVPSHNSFSGITQEPTLGPCQGLSLLATLSSWLQYRRLTFLYGKWVDSKFNLVTPKHGCLVPTELEPHSLLLGHHFW